MGCCLFGVLLAGAPRLAFMLWWIFDPTRMNHTFHTFIWPLVGLIFLPWTTIMYVAVYPGGIHSLDYLWIGLGVLADLASYGQNARARQLQTQGGGATPQ